MTVKEGGGDAALHEKFAESLDDEQLRLFITLYQQSNCHENNLMDLVAQGVNLDAILRRGKVEGPVVRALATQCGHFLFNPPNTGNELCGPEN